MTRNTTGAILFTDAARAHVDLAESSERVARLPPPEMAAAVEAHHGIVADTNGGGLMAFFARGVDAVAAALTIIDDVLADTSGASGPNHVQTGVSFGEIAVDGDDYFGETVIEAARLQAMARPNELLVTEAVHMFSQADAVAAFTPIGAQELKGLPAPIEAHQVTRRETGEAVDDRSVIDESPMSDAFAAVVVADMVGSTELLAELGDAVTIRLRRAAETVLTDAVIANGGRVIDTKGDDLTATFPTASDAVEAAKAMQSGVALYALRSDAVAPFQIRVGVAAAPLALDASAGLGALVAEAAQLEKSAGSSGILVSRSVRLLSRRFGSGDFTEADETRGTHRLEIPTDSLAGLPLPNALGSAPRFPQVGRDAKMAELRAVWEASAAGESRLVFVTGEPGIGKTRLVTEHAKSVHDEGAIVLYGACDAELAVPYRPFASALRPAGDLDAALAEVLEDGSGVLSRLFPASRQGGSEDLGETDRLDLFEAVVSLLDRLATIRPVLLVLDDLHWATRSTVLLLRHLLAERGSSRVLIVGTFRDGEIGRDHPLRDVATTALTDDRANRIRLDGLAEDDVVALLESQVGGALDEKARALARRVHQDSNGSPFFTSELLRHLATTGVVRRVDGVWTVVTPIDELPISESVRSVVGMRLSRVGEEVNRVLTTASVIGLNFDLELLSEAVDRGFEEVLDLVEVAEQASLVSEGDRPGSYVFSHAIVRTTLLEELSSTRRAMAHHRIGDALESLAGDRIDELAHHWRNAVTPIDHSKAIGYLAQAAERDQAALDWEGAVDRYRQIIELLELDRVDDDVLRSETWLGLGYALRAVGDIDYLDAMQAAAGHARAADRSDLLARAAMGSTKPGAWFPDSNRTDDTIIGLGEEALLRLEDDDHLRVRLLATQATLLVFDNTPDPDRRASLAHEAVRLAVELDDHELISSSLLAEFLALWDASTFERRWEIVRTLEQPKYRMIATAEERFVVGFFRASLLLEEVDVEGAKAQLKTLEPWLEATRNTWFRFMVDRMTFAIDQAQMQPDLRERADAMLEWGKDTLVDAAGTWAAQVGVLAIYAGQMGMIVDSLQAAATRSESQGTWNFALAIALIERGDVDEATRVVDGLVDPPRDFMWLVSMQQLAEVGFGLGRTDIARKAFDALLPYRGRLGVIASGTLIWGLVSTSLGRCAIVLEEYGLAEELLAEAIIEADRIEMPYFGATSRRLLATALVRGGVQLTEQRVATLVDEVRQLSGLHGFGGELRAVEALITSAKTAATSD